MALVSLTLVMGPAPRPILARVNPINNIGRQVQKGNMLIVLDTSGSMTGVPGELFDANTELGVDCELGQNCRTVSTTGRCQTAVSPVFDNQGNITGTIPRICANDSHCRSGRCRHGGDPCLTDSDCPTAGTRCSVTNNPCQYNSDCMPTFATCSAGYGMCSSANPTCPAVGQCERDGSLCLNPGGQCTGSYCSNHPTLTCTNHGDCNTAPPAPPSAGLVAHYRLDESAGTSVADSSANNLTATRTGGAWQPTGGRINGAWQASWGDNIAIPSGPALNSILANNRVTVAAWIRPTSANWNHVIMRQRAGADDAHFYLRFHSDRVTFGVCSFSGSCTSVTSNVTLPWNSNLANSTWSHVAGVYDGTAVRVYINGTAAGSTNTSLTMATTANTPAYIGANYRQSDGMGGHFDGLIDEVRLYNVALSAADINVLYGATTPAPPPPPPVIPDALVAHWRFDEASGTTAFDSSGNGHHLVDDGGAAPSFTGGLRNNVLAGGGDIKAPSSAKLNAMQTGLTVMGWFRRNSDSATDRYGLVYREMSNGSGRLPGGQTQWSLRQGPSNQLFCFSMGPSYGPCVGGTTLSPNNRWNHIAFTWDGTRVRGYVNGTPDTESTFIGPLPAATGQVGVGGDFASDQFYDDIYLYSRALSHKEVLEHMKPAGLIGKWDFDEGTGGTTADGSGNGNNGTLSTESGGPLPAWTTGIKGNALTFSGGTVNVPNSASLNSVVSENALSFVAWAMPTVSQWSTIVSRWMGGTTYAYQFQHGMANFPGPGAFEFSASNATTGNATTYPANRWYHVAGSYTGGTARQWVNAVAAGMVPTNGAAIPSTSEPVLFGIHKRYSSGTVNYSGGFNGIIDEARLYKRGMTKEEAAGHMLEAGLVTYQSLEGGWVSGATLEGSPTVIAGQRFNAVQFTGSTTMRLSINPSAAIDRMVSNQTASIAMWVRRTSGDGGLAEHVYDHNVSGRSFVVSIEGGRLKVNGSFTDDTDFPINQWVHVAVVLDYNADKMWVYKDGARDNQVPANGLTEGWTMSGTGREILFGARRAAGGTFYAPLNGALDEIYVYDRPLSETEVKILAGEPSTPLAPLSPPQVENTNGLLAYYPFDEPSGATTAMDASGNGNHASSVCGTAPTFVTGRRGNAAQFGGTRAFQPPVGLLDGRRQVTFSFFVQYVSDSSDPNAAILARQTAAGGGAQSIRVQVGTTQCCHLGCNASCASAGNPGRIYWNWNGSNSLPTPPTAGWDHVAVVIDDDTNRIRYYRNSSLSFEITDATLDLSATGRPLMIGALRESAATTGCTSVWHGAYVRLDDLRIYGRALDPSEIGQLALGSPPTVAEYCQPNTCQPVANNCPGITPNVCTGAATNTCLGVSSTDTCIVSSQNPGPARMCRFGMRLCTVDADCTQYPDDECVPATSRAIVAKRVLRNTVLRNLDVMNFGLMTFSQGRPTANTTTFPSGREDYYFTYFPVQGGTTVTTRHVKFFTEAQLERISVPGAPGGRAFHKKHGPVSTFTDAGVVYHLPVPPSQYASANSRYAIFRGKGNFAEIDHSWIPGVCEYNCDITGSTDFNFGYRDTSDITGTGTYQGTYYEYTVTTGSTNSFGSRIQRLNYEGRQYNQGGVVYNYFTPRTDYYFNAQDGTNRPAVSGPINCDYNHSCSDTCGALWDPNLMPELKPGATEVEIQANLSKLIARMEKAENGGLMMWERTPIGCSLYNDGTTMYSGAMMPQSNLAEMRKYSAFHHMKHVILGDALDCRESFVVLVTDGMATGPGDVTFATGDYGVTTCADPACAVNPNGNDDPAAQGCACRAVNSAYRIRREISQQIASETGRSIKPVKTYVVGFSPDANLYEARIVNSNIARAGGTCARPPRQVGESMATGSLYDKCSFRANNEIELNEALQSVVFDAIRGSYSTAPLSAASGVQMPDSVQASTIVMDARVDFPTWSGHLLAWETDTSICATLPQSQTAPCLLWDTSVASAAQWRDTGAGDTYTWKNRRVYFLDTVTNPSSPTVTKIRINPTTGAIENRALLQQLGLGATEEEAEQIVRWLLSDPAQGNPAPFGPFINSTPIDVGPPGLSRLPGGRYFYDNYVNRPSLIYVGAGDGMLHAFFKTTTTVSGHTYPGGQEAFAFIPPEMFKVITRIYAQGGQKADPAQHVFGLTSSPKVKNVCVSSGTECASESTAGPHWKTLLSMTSGWGENELWVLDITDAFNNNSGTPTQLNDPPFRLMWHSDYVSSAADKNAYDQHLGLTVSVPAFYFGKTANLNDHRLIFTSGYQHPFSPDPKQGLHVVNANALTGAIVDIDPLPPPTTTCTNGVERVALTDVAVARDYSYTEKGQILAAYFGDTWGNLYRYTPNVTSEGQTTNTGSVSLVDAFSCDHPLHFSPAIVQLDRDDPMNYARQIYIVQVTNSTLDPTTQGFARSRLVIKKDTANGAGRVEAGTNWTDIVMTVGDSRLCAHWNASSNTCAALIPDSARPTATPLAILKADGTGFQIITLWYSGETAACGQGTTYLTLHEVLVNGTINVKAGLTLSDQPITSAVIAGDKVLYTERTAEGTRLVDITSRLNQTFVVGGAISHATRNGGEPFRRMGWTELP